MGLAEIAYQSERATLYVGDARAALPTLETESVDVVVTDPPYGVEYRSNVRQDRFRAMAGDTPEEARALLDAVTPDLIRSTRRSRHLYTFGLPLEHELVSARVDLEWDKARLGSGDLALPWSSSHEPVFFHVCARLTRRTRGCSAASWRRGCAAARCCACRG